jgi:hypothetical protein
MLHLSAALIEPESVPLLTVFPFGLQEELDEIDVSD